jgi:peptidoglycan/xylan/chitin deacetylase (PgdA/CDA1 family)
MNRSSNYARGATVYAARPLHVTVYLCIKRMLLHFCKAIGLFRLAARLTLHGLRILCYHGFSVADESEFSRRTFIDADTFVKRMAFLKRNGFHVLGLDEALDLLDRGAVPPLATVITIDDGFYSVYAKAHPVFKTFAFPVTVYVTTYYTLRQNPVFNLVVSYLFWKTTNRELDLTGLGLPRTGVVSLRAEGEKTAVLEEIIRHGNAACDETGRVALSRALGERFGINYDGIRESRMFTIMTLEQIRELSASGVDIELHTHRHVFPLDHDRATAEIRENRAVLEPFLGKKLVHFCYPSGIWAREQWPWLAEAGIRSAVTCDRGFNFKKTPRYGLKRIGDDEGLSQIEFEAEAYGFMEVLRAMKHGFRFS